LFEYQLTRGAREHRDSGGATTQLLEYRQLLVGKLRQHSVQRQHVRHGEVLDEREYVRPGDASEDAELVLDEQHITAESVQPMGCADVRIAAVAVDRCAPRFHRHHRRPSTVVVERGFDVGRECGDAATRRRVRTDDGGVHQNVITRKPSVVTVGAADLPRWATDG